MSKFSVEIEVGGFDFVVEGDATPGEPDRGYGHPENWVEGTNDELEIEKISLKLEDGKLLGTFEDVFQELIYDWYPIEEKVWKALRETGDDAGFSEPIGFVGD